VAGRVSGWARGSIATFLDERLGSVRLTLDGRVERLIRVAVGRTTHVVIGGESWTIDDVEPRGAGTAGGAGHADGTVRSPMPGTVIAVHVAAGDTVVAGQPVAIVEAMKMEHALTAPFDGTVGEVLVASGSQVALDAAVVTVIPATG
jgi:acetyl-CoA/propionyl-CoA carboxylase, biotin carboxylase, biotin carboxyl carrier protein